MFSLAHVGRRERDARLNLFAVRRMLAACVNEIQGLRVQLRLARELLDERDGEYAHLASRCARAETDLDNYRRFFAATVPDPYEDL